MMFSSIGNTTPFRFWQLAYQVHAFDRYIDDFPPKFADQWLMRWLAFCDRALFENVQ